MGGTTVRELSRAILEKEIKGKRVLFITTKELSYIRNSQEIKLLRECSASLEIVGFENKTYVSRLIKVYFSLCIRNVKSFDFIFIGFEPQLVLPIWRHKFRNNRIIVDFFISMYDTFVNDRKRFKQNSIIARFLKYLDVKTLKFADKIICDTCSHGNYFCTELGAEKGKLQTFYLEADTGIYYPRKVSKPSGLQNKFIVLYFGSILPLQGVDVVLEAFDLLKNDNRFYFYMIGPLDNSYAKPISNNIEYIQWLSQENLADYIASADLCLAGHFNGEIDKAKRTIPGKAFIYSAMEKPMVLGDNEANHELFSNDDIGIYYVEMSNAVALSDVILNAFENIQKRNKDND